MTAPVSDTFVSVVLPLRDDGDIVEEVVGETMTVLERNYTNYELVLVDDGSQDGTAERVRELLQKYRCMRYVRLSRSFGAEVAVSAGLDTVIGDYVVILQPDSDPPGIIPEMVRRARSGSGVIFGVRSSRAGEALWERLGARLFYAVANRILRLDVPERTGSLVVLNRQAVNGITRIKDKYRSLRLLGLHVGYGSECLPYEPVPRRSRRRTRGLGASAMLALGLMVSQSTRLLRLVAGLGLLASFFNVLYMGYVIAVYFFKSRVAEGWTTTSLQLSVMFFLLFLILAVLSEYVGRSLEEVKDRPLYHVMEERNSNVLIADATRRNVVRESEGVNR